MKNEWQNSKFKTELNSFLDSDTHIFCVPAVFPCHRKTVYFKGKFKDESFRSSTRNTDGKTPQLHRAGSRKMHDHNEYAFIFDRFHQRSWSSCRLLWHHTNIVLSSLCKKKMTDFKYNMETSFFSPCCLDLICSYNENKI